MYNMGQPTFNFTTKLWKRSQNSYATTVPKEILAIKSAPTEDAIVEWSIDEETGGVIAKFKQRGDSDGA